MRILILNNLFPPHVLGGYEIACRNVAEGLRNRGHVVQALVGQAPFSIPDDPKWLKRTLKLRAYGPVSPETLELAKVQEYEASCSQSTNSAELLSAIQQFKPDLVYVWHIWGVGGQALLDTVELTGTPWVMHLMDIVPTYLSAQAEPLASSLFTRTASTLLVGATVISMSQQIINEIKQTSGIVFDKSPTIIPGWVDCSKISQRSEYFVDNKLRLVTAGALGVHKGTDLIIRACADLITSGYRNFEVDIFGLGFAAEWSSMATRLGVNECVRFHAPLSQAELLERLPHYDVFLFPTQEREPFGFAPLEAAGCGVAPILTRNAGAAERIVDRVHGLKIDRTANSLADAIKLFLDKTVDVATIGRQGARLVRDDLTFDHCLDLIEATLRDEIRVIDQRQNISARTTTLLATKHELGRYITMRP